MKRCKKMLAILLSTLMIVLSVPVTEVHAGLEPGAGIEPVPGTEVVVEYYVGEGSGGFYNDYTSTGLYFLRTPEDCGFSAPSNKEFSHWQDDITGETYNAGQRYGRVSPNRIYSFTAIWKTVAPTTYTVTYIVDGSTYATYTREAGSATPKPADPTKTDYVFTGWSPSVASTVTGNATYTATWFEDLNNNGLRDDQDPESCVAFTSTEPFTLTFYARKSWDGALAFSQDLSVSSWRSVPTTIGLIGGTIFPIGHAKYNPSTGLYAIYLRGAGNTSLNGGWAENVLCLTPESNGTITVRGNIETLLDYKTVLRGEHPSYNDAAFYSLFRDQPISDASALTLPASEAPQNCYRSMFYNCTSLTAAPSLPALRVWGYAYTCMFYNCTSLTQAPELPATTLTAGAYYGMFQNCSSLTSAPSRLPAMSVPEEGYCDMFMGCSSLTQAPELPATTLGINCYARMFYDCLSLTTPPALPATTLAENCYRGMFAGSGIKISETVQQHNGDYYNVAYRIPSSGTGTMGTDSTVGMFIGTSGPFTGSPEINKTYYLPVDVPTYNVTFNLAGGSGSFPSQTKIHGVSLTLPTTEPTKDDYVFTGWKATNGTNYAAGSDYTANEATTLTAQWWKDADGNGVLDDIEGSCLTFTGTGRFTLSFSSTDWTGHQYIVSSGTGRFSSVGTRFYDIHGAKELINPPCAVEYSTDGVNWTEYNTAGEEISCSPTNIILLRGVNIDAYHPYIISNQPQVSGPYARVILNPVDDGTLVDCTGNIESMLDYRGNYYEWDSASGDWSNRPLPDLYSSNPSSSQSYTYSVNATGAYCFKDFFKGNACLRTAPEINSSNFDGGFSAFASFLENCTSLTNPPSVIPRTGTYDDSMFESMFRGCTSLEQTPTFLGGTVTRNAYSRMFEGCTALVTPPVLPSTALGEYAYYRMFSGCTSLVAMPDLPATTLPDGAYSGMFENCTSLTSLKPLPATSVGIRTYEQMFYGCTGLKVSDVVQGYNGEYYSIPYNIPSEGVGTCESNSMQNMFKGTSGPFTGTAEINKTYYLPADVPTYTVTFNLAGGSGSFSDMTKTHDVALTLPTTKPTRIGYTFTGWKATDGTTYSAGGSYTANEDTTLTAQWQANTYTVTFNLNGGSGSFSNITKSHGIDITLPTTKPTRTGYTFTGWKATNGTIYAAGGSYTTDAATTMTAQWAEDANNNGIDDKDDPKYTVTYTDGVDGEEIFADEVHRDVLVGLPTPEYTRAMVRPGYVFGGWIPSLAATVNANATYRATWKKDDNGNSIADAEEKFTVIYKDGVGGTVFEDQRTSNLSQGANTPGFTGTPSRPGYVFAGFKPAIKPYVNAINANTSSEIIYTVEWTEWNEGIAPTGITLDRQLVVLRTDEEYPETLTATISPDGAVYQEIEWFIENPNNLSGSPSDYLRIENAGSDLKVNLTGLKETWIVIGNGRYFPGAVEVVARIKGTGITARCGVIVAEDDKVNIVKLSLVGPEGKGMYSHAAAWTASDTYKEYTLPECEFTAPEGQAFVGWRMSDPGARYDGQVLRAGTTLDIDISRGREILAQAQFAPLITVKYTNGLGEIIGEPMTCFEGDRTPVVADPTRDGYVFNGWDGWQDTVRAADAVNGVITYNATWGEDFNGNGIDDKNDPKYTVTYTDGVDGVEVFADQVHNNVLVDMPTPAFEGETTRAGYVFGGWEPEVAEKVSGNATYTATWKEDKNGNGTPDENELFTVVYKDGDTIWQTMTNCLVGMPTPVPYDPNKLGYILVEWAPTFDAETFQRLIRAEDANADNEIIYAAVWAEDKNGNYKDDATEEHFTITYTDGKDGASFVDDVHEDVLIHMPTPDFTKGNGKKEPVLKDYVFAGWNPQVADRVTESVIYTATWNDDKNNNGTADDEETFKVIYKDGADGAVFADNVTGNLSAGDNTPTFGDDPTREGYTFKGWTPEFKTKVAAADANAASEIIYTATWEQTGGQNPPQPGDTHKVTYVYVDAPTGAAAVPTEVEGIEAGTEITIAAAPAAVRGYIFKGWVVTAPDNVTVEGGKFEMPAADVTITGTWKADQNNGGEGNGTADDEETFKVIYKDGVDGEEVFADKVNSNLSVGSDTPTFGDDPTREGYTFKGWAPELKAKVAAEDANANSEIIYTATWEQTGGGQDPPQPGDTYKVTYVYENAPTGAAAVPTEVEGIEAGTEITIAAAPAAVRGYIFKGWVITEPTGVEVDNGKFQMPAADVTITGTWKADQNNGGEGNGTADDEETFKVIYKDGVDGEEVFADKVNSNLSVGSDTPTFGDDPTREGYTFKGWTPELKAKVAAEDANAASEIIYTATWEQTGGQNPPQPGDTHKVTYVYVDAPTGAAAVPAEVEGIEAGTEITIAEAPAAVRGYIFSGWVITEPTGVEVGNGKFQMPAADVTITGTWKADQNNGGEGNGTADDEETFTVIYKDGVDGEEVFADNVTGNLSAGDNTPTFGDDPTRDGYTFKGWTPALKAKVAAEDANANSEIIYTATWEQTGGQNPPQPGDTYKVTYVYENAPTGAAAVPTEVEGIEAGTEITVAAAPAAVRGYIFKGWVVTEPSGITIESGKFEMPAADVTITGTWKADQNNGGEGNGTADDEETFKVIYKDGADGAVFADKVTSNLSVGSDTPTFGDDPTRDGYTFKGWTPELKAKVAAADANADSEIIYTATWEQTGGGQDPPVPPTPTKTYTVTYTDGVPGEVIFEDQTTSDLEEGANTPAFEGSEPTRDGYTFKGWNPQVAETVTANVTYTAQWEADGSGGTNPPTPTPVKYTVTYTDGVDGEEVFADDVHTELEEGATTPEFTGSTEREGYTFKGWSPEVADKVTSNITYTAQWEADGSGGTNPPTPTPVKYTVTYTDGVDGEKVFEDDVHTDLEEGANTPSFRGTLEREGYTFKGWSPEVAEKVTSNITYTAQWTEDGSGGTNPPTPTETYTVTYTDGVADAVIFEDQVTTDLEAGADTPAFAGDEPTREGYTFAGWYPEKADTVTASVTYTAQWDPAGTTPPSGTVKWVKFDVNGDGEVDSIDLDVMMQIARWVIDIEELDESERNFYLYVFDLGHERGEGDGEIDSIDLDVAMKIARYVVDAHEVEIPTDYIPNQLRP